MKFNLRGRSVSSAAFVSSCALVACSAPDASRNTTPPVIEVGQTHEELETTKIQAVLDSRYLPSDVRHSFHTKFGETIDCIDFFAQAGVKQLAEQGHPITELPPVDVRNRHSLPDDLFNGKPDENGAARECPEGTVPMLHMTVADVQAAGGLNATHRKKPHPSPPASCPLIPELDNYAHAIENYPAPNVSSVHIDIAFATMSIEKPAVPKTPIYDHSLAQIWLTAGCNFNLDGRTCSGTDCIESVEVGWDVDATYLNKSKPNPDFPHLFIFATTDGYSTGCYNNDSSKGTCDATWVGAPQAVLTPGASLTPSIPGGTVNELSLAAGFMTPSWASVPGWLVQAGVTGSDRLDIGYYPGTDFKNQMTGSADSFQVGGEIEDQTDDMVVPMGNGASAQSGYGNAAYFHDYVAHTGEYGSTHDFYVTGVTEPAGKAQAYSLSTTTAPGGDWANYFYYGSLDLQAKVVLSHQALQAIQAIAAGRKVTTSSINVGEDGAAYARGFQNGAWSAPSAISAVNLAPAGAGVSTGALSSTQTALALVGNDGKVYVTTQTNGGAWSALSAVTAANFAKPGAMLASGTPTGQLSFFVADTSGKLQRITWNSTTRAFGAPVALTAANYAPSGASLAVGSRANGEFDVFVIGPDGTLKYMFYNLGIWGGPLSLSSASFAPPGAPIAAAVDVHGFFNVMVVGNTGALYTDWDVTPAWSGMTALTATGFAPAGAGVSAINFNNQSLNVFLADTSGSVDVLTNAGTSWQGPTSIASYATVPGAALSAVVQGTSELDVFTSTPHAPYGVIESIETAGTWASPVAL